MNRAVRKAPSTLFSIAIWNAPRRLTEPRPSALPAAISFASKIEEFRDRFANPYVAAERGYVDAVIQPRDTRKKPDPGTRNARNQARQEPTKEAWKHTAMRKVIFTREENER